MAEQGYPGGGFRPPSYWFSGEPDEMRQASWAYAKKQWARDKRKGRRPALRRYGKLKKELKFFDTAQASVTPGTGGLIMQDSLNHVPTGAGEEQRVGRKIWISHVQARFVYSTGSSVADTMRLIIYLDKQANGAAATVTDILEGASSGSYYNLSNVPSRFKILCDKHLTCHTYGFAGDGTSNVAASTAKWLKLYLPVKAEVVFDSTTGAMSEICCKNLGVLAISTNGQILIGGDYRIRYTD